eukprot:1323915-Pyramimonas_sp.AAC.1
MIAASARPIPPSAVAAFGPKKLWNQEGFQRSPRPRAFPSKLTLLLFFPSTFSQGWRASEAQGSVKET